jgi:hypothetical protein
MNISTIVDAIIGNKRYAAVFVFFMGLLCSAIAVPRLGIGDRNASQGAPTNPPPISVPNSSTINIQQSGKWTIGLIDTPTVKLSAQGNTLVFMPGDSAVPFLKTVSFNIESGTSQNNVSITIPEGKRLVIEHISARAQGPVGQKFIAQIQTTVSHTESPRGIFWLVFFPQGTFSTIDVSTASQPMHVYAEPGNPPLLFVATRTAINGTAFVEATISGYLVKIR